MYEFVTNISNRADLEHRCMGGTMKQNCVFVNKCTSMRTWMVMFVVCVRVFGGVGDVGSFL